MAEPKVEFDLTKIDDESVKELFDQLRRWFEYREDRGSPSMKTFSGELSIGDEIDLFIPGVVYGAVGYTQISVTRSWILMSVSSIASKNYFGTDPSNTNANYVRVKGNSSDGSALGYKVTVFYRDQ